MSSKRRPLVIRKNNFVLTKQNDSTSLESGSNAPGSTTNAHSVTRVQMNPLSVGASSDLHKLNLTLHSNTSGNRALNNTQKIGLAGQGNTNHGINSNESLGSEVSLSQTRNQLSKTLAAVNASIKKA